MNREKKVAMALALIGKGVDVGDPRFATEAGQKLYLFDMDPINWEVCGESTRVDVQNHLAELIEAELGPWNRSLSCGHRPRPPH